MRPPPGLTEEFLDSLYVEMEPVVEDQPLDIDLVETMWWPLKSGQYQPVYWPMRLHRHTQECNRA